MNLLPRLFVKDYKNYQNASVRFAYGKRCGIVGIISNLILCAIKIITGLLIGSISIMADGINNLADAGSSIITLIGFKLASMPSDKDHPFGHQRYEYITGLIVSIIILIIGLLLFKSSVEKLIAFEVTELDKTTSIVSAVVLFIAILIKLWQGFFNRKYGKLINSTALIATSTDSINDSISTSAVFISLLVTIFYPNAFLDGVMGIIVSIFIFISGVKLIKETISPLIGEAPTREFTNEVVDKILSYDGVLGVHDLVIHSYGPEKIFITVHVEVDSHVPILISHDIIDNIERDFLNEKNLNVCIHMDPIDTKDEDVIRLKGVVTEIMKELDPNLLFHDFRIVKGITHTNVLFDIEVPIKYHLSNDKIKEFIDEKLHIYDDKLRTVITFDIDYTGEK